MKLGLWGFALLCGVSFSAHADAEHDRIARERAAANAKLADDLRECETRFIVAPCVEAARKENRASLALLRQQELQLGEAHRHAAAEARRKAIAEKVEAQAQQGRASDAAPEAPRVRVRREPQPAPAPPGKRAAEAAAPQLPTAGASGADRASLEQRNQQKFAARASEAQAHREAVARRNAQRAAQGKLAAPLPLPGASAAPR